MNISCKRIFLTDNPKPFTPNTIQDNASDASSTRKKTKSRSTEQRTVNFTRTARFGRLVICGTTHKPALLDASLIIVFCGEFLL